MSQRAVIFINSPLPDPGAARACIQPGDVIIAADGGARVALSLGLLPQAILGDLDSLTETEIRVFEDMGVHLLRYPPAKNETDLELALSYALRAGHFPITILGGHGGRFDQALGNLAVLSAPEAIQAAARLDDGLTEAFFIASEAILRGRPGDTVSLLPWGVPAEGVETDGLCYPLHGETLFPHRSRGISNEMLAHTASIRVQRGLLLCIHQRRFT
ncbi:MAG: thiamine diphosphokinase [Anaerolineales bacterium]|nr:thiamine diphosphokinase [Anaerolineales bacterium]MCX7753757.1 thiamine diphosphokinase [Anaerolineales bacterium]MDW8278868.1 thiamine diphosphokinase [Anaerolineales bacterium]